MRAVKVYVARMVRASLVMGAAVEMMTRLVTRKVSRFSNTFLADLELLFDQEGLRDKAAELRRIRGEEARPAEAAAAKFHEFVKED